MQCCSPRLALACLGASAAAFCSPCRHCLPVLRGMLAGGMMRCSRACRRGQSVVVKAGGARVRQCWGQLPAGEEVQGTCWDEG